MKNILLFTLSIYSATLVYAQNDLTTIKGCSLLGLNLGSIENLIVETEEFSRTYKIDDNNVITEESTNLKYEKELYKYFNLKVRIKWIDDNPPNAFATNRIIDSKKIDGTILLGQNLMEQTESDVFEYIIWHETAHIFDFKSRLDLSGKKRELFADYVAGFMLGWRHASGDFWSNLMTKAEPEEDWSINMKERLRQTERIFKKFYDIGDYNFNSPSHHGTPTERLNIVKKGYKLGYAEGTIIYKELRISSLNYLKGLKQPYKNMENASRYFSLKEDAEGNPYSSPNLYNIYLKFKTL